MDVDKCVNCGKPVPEGIQVCPICIMPGLAPREIEAAQELRKVANILSITADTDANIKAALNSILNLADKFERGM